MSRLHGEPFAPVPEWLLDRDVSDRAVRLFAVLGRHANRDGRAFPGRRGLAQRLRCSPASLDRAVAELVSAKALAVRQQYRRDGGQTSNDYWLWPAQPAPEVLTGEEGPHHERGGGVLTREEGALFTGEEGKRNESQLERQPDEREPHAVASFDMFWTTYPRRVGKGAARTAWDRALRTTDPRRILAGAERFVQEVRGREARFVPHPATWLNQERWLDDPGANNGRRPDVSQSRDETEGRVAL